MYGTWMKKQFCQRGRNFRLIFVSVEAIKLHPREADRHILRQAD